MATMSQRWELDPGGQTSACVFKHDAVVPLCFYTTLFDTMFVLILLNLCCFELL